MKGQPNPLGRSPLPSGADIVFLALLYLLIGVRANSLFDDASTGWHLVSGQYIIAHLHLPRYDLISYTFPTRPWVPFEWLFDAVAAALVQIGGLPLLAVVAGSAIALLFFLLFQDARRAGCPFLTALALTLIGALASSVHWLARPHLFTFFGVYVFARLLEAFHLRHLSGPAVTLLLGVTMLVWSNAHPGFVIGFAMIVIYLVSEAVSAAVVSGPGGSEARRRAKVLLAALTIVVAASFVNPNGLALYPSFGSALQQLGRNVMTQEFQSPTFHGELYSVSLELLFASFILGLATSRRRPWLGQSLLVLAFAFLALNGVRNVPLFVIVSIPVIADLLADSNLLALVGATGGAHAGWVEAWVRGWQRIERGYNQMEWRCTMHLAPIAAVALLALSCVSAGRIPGVRPLVSSSFDPRHVPTTTLAYIRDHDLAWDRGLSLDNWGGYIRYETGERIFIDDRTTFYPWEFYQRYVQMMFAQPGWRKRLDDYRFEWVLVPKNSPLAAALRERPTWQISAEDAAAYLFLRKSP
ncbi:MAG TPA: hypothetical protein VKT83_04005 [bacterium]|nr:hypothetical protein [bacterium]